MNWIIVAALIVAAAAGYFIRKWIEPARQDYSKTPMGDERIQ